MFKNLCQRVFLPQILTTDLIRLQDSYDQSLGCYLRICQDQNTANNRLGFMISHTIEEVV